MPDACPNDDALQSTLVSSNHAVTKHVEQCAHCRTRLNELSQKTSSVPVPAGEATSHVEAQANLPAGIAGGDVELASTLSLPQRTQPMIGKYPIAEVLGKGGQAVVYRAIHPTLGKDVVIKLGHKAAEPGQTSMLVTEGKLLAKLSHANLVRIHDLDFHEGKPFLVMEYVRGGSLDARGPEARPTPREAATLVACVARAAATAHKVGIVHLDIKPANVLIDDSGTPLLADFGMARLCWALDGNQPKSVGGTPRYMAPEQARGETARIGPAADVYALGGILYFLLCGQDPRRGDTLFEIIDKAGRGELDWKALEATRPPQRLLTCCRRALALKPEDRYASADALADDLESFVRWQGRRRFLVASVAGAGLAAGAAYALWPAQPVEWPSEAQLLIADVQRGGRHMGELAHALPLCTGDAFQVRCLLPRGFQTRLLFADAEGAVESFEKCGRRTHPPFESVIFPAEGNFRLGPLKKTKEGTGLLLICAGAELPELGPIQEALGAEPWPKLPRNLLVWLTSEQTGVRSFDERGMHVVKGDEVHDVESRLDELRRVLSQRFLVGLAFPRIND